MREVEVEGEISNFGFSVSVSISNSVVKLVMPRFEILGTSFFGSGSGSSRNSVKRSFQFQSLVSISHGEIEARPAEERNFKIQTSFNFNS